MNLVPFVSVDGTPFSVTQDEVLLMRGRPLGTGRNAVGLNELDYGTVVYRFQDNGRLEEVTREAPLVIIGQATVPFDALAAFVRSEDAGMFERAGFIVAPRFGLAFDPKEPFWVTALAAHCLDTWRAIR